MDNKDKVKAKWIAEQKKIGRALAKQITGHEEGFSRGGTIASFMGNVDSLRKILDIMIDDKSTEIWTPIDSFLQCWRNEILTLDTAWKEKSELWDDRDYYKELSENLSLENQRLKATVYN